MDREQQIDAAVRKVLSPTGRRAIGEGCRCIGCGLALDYVRRVFREEVLATLSKA